MTEKVDIPVPPAPATQATTGLPPAAAKNATNTNDAEKTADAGQQLERLNSSLKSAVASYRALVIKSNPDVLPDLINGDSIEALDASLAQAKDLIGRVKSGLENRAAAAAAAARVPFGAPQRGTYSAEVAGALSTREKITLGVEKFRK